MKTLITNSAPTRNSGHDVRTRAIVDEMLKFRNIAREAGVPALIAALYQDAGMVLLARILDGISSDTLAALLDARKAIEPPATPELPPRRYRALALWQREQRQGTPRRCGWIDHAGRVQGDPLVIAARYEAAARDWDVLARNETRPIGAAIFRRQADEFMERAARVLAQAEEHGRHADAA